MPDLNYVKHAVTNLSVEELLLQRWSPRAFSEQPVSDADLQTIFTAASWAASSYNEQPWRFLLGRKGDETYKKIFGALAQPNQQWAGSAPVLFASFGKKTFTKNGQPNSYALHDSGAATQNLALQATAMGMHLHGMGGFDKDLLRAYFGVPTDYEAGACWALGYLGDPDNLPDNYRTQEQQPRDRLWFQRVGPGGAALIRRRTSCRSLLFLLDFPADVCSFQQRCGRFQRSPQGGRAQGAGRCPLRGRPGAAGHAARCHGALHGRARAHPRHHL